MAMSVNKVILIGNVGIDPEIRTMNDGREMASISLATSYVWKDKMTGEKREKTEWHRVVVFNETIVRVIKDYVQKGSRVYVEGELQTRKWQDQSGADRYSTEVVVQGFTSNLILLDKRSAHDDAAPATVGAGTYTPGNASPYGSLDDEVPF